MKDILSDKEGRVLHGLVAEASGDIVVRLDQDGFITFASHNVAELGHDLSSLLVMPHICDLAEHEHRDALRNFAQEALGGNARNGWFEFPLSGLQQTNDFGLLQARRWYALSLRPIDQDDGVAQGALGLIRSVQHKRSLEGELHNRAVTEPLTGLSNRHAFAGNLRKRLARGGHETMMIFAIDGMRALFMQYGQRTADEIMWGFAKYLETMAQPGYELAQIDNERLAVIVPEMSATSTRVWGEDVLRTFSQLALPSSSRAPKLTASAGMARLECSVDWTLRQAELGLVMARAGGGNQVGECGYSGGSGYFGSASSMDGANERVRSTISVGVAATAR